MALPILTFKGRWNAVNNTVTLTGNQAPSPGGLSDGVGTLGDCYIIYTDPSNVYKNIFDRDLGTGTKSWIAMNYMYYDGSEWQMIGDVTSGGGSPTGPAGGDLGGTYPNPTVEQIKGKAIATLATGLFKYNGTSWVFDTSSYIVLSSLSAVSPLSYNSGTGVFSIQVANGSQDGYLSSTDWTTFNSKQVAGNYITALTGDVTASGPGSASATIANNAVTYAKMQAVSTTSKLLGSSSTTTAVQEITLGSGLSLSGTTLNSTATASPGGSSTQVQYNNSGSFDGASQVTINTTDENLVFIPTSSTTPVASDSTGLKVWANSRVGIEQPFVTPYLGPEYPLQASFGYKIVGGYTVSGSANIFAWGQLASAMSAVNGGSVTARTYDATNLLPNYARYGLVTATTANSYAEQRTSISGKGSVMGNNTYGGGSKLIYTFGLGTYNSGERLFFGYTGSTLTWSGSTDPSANTNLFGLGKDAGDTTFQWMENDGSAGTATKTNTTITPNQNDVYRLTVFVPSNATTIYMQLEVMTKSSITLYTRSTSSDIPATGTLIYQRMYVSGAATGVACSIMMIQIEEELY